MHYQGFPVSPTSKGFYLRDSSPGLDKLPASVHDVLHLQVHRRGHHGHDVALPQIEPGRVHEVQEDAEPLGVDLRVQVNHTQVTLQLVCEDAVEQATATQTHVSQEQAGLAVSYSQRQGSAPRPWASLQNSMVINNNCRLRRAYEMPESY